MTVLGVWIAAFLTLATFSFLFKDNPVYKVAEYLVVGVSAGYWFVILVQTVFMDLVVDPLKKDLALGLFSSPQALLAFTGHLLPVVLGVMMWLRFFPRLAWLARIPIAFVLGTGAGVAIPTAIQTFVLSPLWATLTLAIVPTSWQAGTAGLLGQAPPSGDPVSPWTAANNLLILAGVMCGIVYFFFSKEHRGVTGRAASFGIWVLMVGFGSTFGFTVMSRVSLLVGRIQFLLNDWLRDNLWKLVSG